jgi:hypothetical protein
MPRGDRTGPMGAGPMTGRAAGYCAGYDRPGYTNQIPGRGAGMGWGHGRGWRHWYHATGVPGWARFGGAPAWGYGPFAEPLSREQEVESLKEQAEGLKAQLDAISQRLSELGKEE